MKIEEVPVVFSCQKDDLIGIIHKPENSSSIGVLIVVGGPQYRVGSHRQFILLARMLAANGIPVMRFDYRGMGDSEGNVRTFTDVDEDIKSALDTYYQHCSALEQVVIWGLCDAASAVSFYAYQDERVKGLVLLNPWVYTEQGAAKIYLKHYYLKRLLSITLWRKVLLFQFNYRESIISLVSIMSNLFSSGKELPEKNANDTVSLVNPNLNLPVRIRECLQRFKYPVLFILSGRDLTADEFRDTVEADEEWQKLFKHLQISRVELTEADHTFSSAKWRDKVTTLTLDWIRNLH